MTGRQQCTNALRLVNILDPTDTIDAEQLRDTFMILGDVVEELSINRQLIYRVVRSAFNLTSGQATYTIGTGGDFNVPRPLWIDDVGVVFDRTASSPIEKPIGPMLTESAYASIPDKSATGPAPTMAFYDYQYAPALAVGLGNVVVYPKPDASLAQLVLYLPTPIPAFASYDTDYTYPPGYQRLIRYKLAAEMCGFYGRPVPSRVERTLIRAEGDLKRANFRPTDAKFPVSLSGGRRRGFNVLRGS